MKYTTNLNLPQWELTDRIQMEDFNAMCAAIDAAVKTAHDAADAAYSPSNKPTIFKEVIVGNSTAVGDALTTFSFTPSFILVNTIYYPAVVPQGNSAVVYNTSTSTNSTYGIGLKLSGKQLILNSRGSNISSVTLRVIAFA